MVEDIFDDSVFLFKRLDCLVSGFLLVASFLFGISSSTDQEIRISRLFFQPCFFLSCFLLRTHYSLTTSTITTAPTDRLLHRRGRALARAPCFLKDDMPVFGKRSLHMGHMGKSRDGEKKQDSKWVKLGKKGQLQCGLKIQNPSAQT